MADQRIKIFRHSDKAVVQQLRKLAKAVPIEAVSVSATGFIALKSAGLEEGSSAELDWIVERDSYLLETINFPLPGLNCTYHRGGYAGAQDANNLSPLSSDIQN